LLVVLFLLLLGGCARVANVHHAADYDPLAQDGAKYAVGGFVLGSQTTLDSQAEIGSGAENSDPRAQTDAWANELYGPLLAGRAGLNVWAWSALRDNIPADTITAVQAEYAKGSGLPPEMITPLAADLPEITYLVLARIDRNDIEIGSNTPAVLGNQAANESRDPHAETDMMTRSVKTRRIVKVTMNVFDLRSGRSVWSGAVTRNKTELYSPSEEDLDQKLVVTPSTEEGAAPEIRVKGASLAMPELDALLGEACRDLVGNLFAIAD
jgi:hypothetical protein